MLIVSFNVNGIRARVHQIEALIERYQPDVIGLQETKVTNEQFPMEWVNGLGYQAYIHGQKTHYGVALLSKLPAKDLQYGFPTDEEDAQRRMIMGTFETPKGGQLRVLNGYFPQGENIKHEVKFPAKRRFYADLSSYLENSASPDEPLLVMGDLNISATDLDIGIGDANRKRWLQTGKTSFQPEERAWIKKLYDWGLTDSYRSLHPERADLYSWFDYRSRGFEDTPKRGLRIDAIMPTQPLLEQCTDASIELEIRGMEKPSDHAPVLARFDI